MDTLSQITDIVHWYNRLPKGFSEIGKLQDAIRKIATLLFYFSGEVGDAYEQKNQKEFSRKVAQSKQEDFLIKEGKSAAAAKKMAEVAVESLLNLEQQSDSIYRKSNLLLENAKNVMEAMRQQISNLKQERSLELQGGMAQQK